MRQLLWLVVKYIYNQRSLPPIDPACLLKLDEAAERVVQKLQALNARMLPLSDEGKQWVLNMQMESTEIMKKNLHLVAWALYPNCDFKNMVFVDHGGAFGLVSFFAKQLGFSFVVYNDIYEPLHQQAQILGETLGLPADAYIRGELRDVCSFLNSNPRGLCALVSVNVIEHVYDIDELLEVCSRLSPAGATLVLSTSANPFNPLVRRRHQRHHNQYEYEDGVHEGFVLPQSHRAFYKVRFDIIGELAPSLPESDRRRLASATRGLHRSAIQDCVKSYQATGKIEVEPDHPTNTCDPMTGCWEERLLDVGAVVDKLSTLGFSVRLSGGYYSGRVTNATMGNAKKFVARICNHAISFMRAKGACIAPSLTVHASHAGLQKTPPLGLAPVVQVCSRTP